MGDGRDSVDLADLFGLDGERIQVGRLLGAASQGQRYTRVGAPGMAVKLFTPAYLFRAAPDLRARLTWMIDHPPAGPATVGEHHRVAWPRELVVDRAGALAGYTMPAPPETVELRQVMSPARRAYAGRGAPGWVARFDDWRLLVATARDLAATVAALHERGYVVGDLNDTNVRVTSGGQVALVDCDTIQVVVDGKAHLSPVGRPEFTPVELLAQRGRPMTSAVDDYALAVHCFAFLLGGHRPYAGTWRGGGERPSALELARRGSYALAGDEKLAPPAGLPSPDVLPAELRVMFDHAFGPAPDGAPRRPTAARWRDALGALAEDLRSCPASPTHHFRSGLDSCPWCALDDLPGRPGTEPAAPGGPWGPRARPVTPTPPPPPPARRPPR
ncbi:hypothetical protein I7412_41790, partial [Frankia sp. CN6]|nr:hypothetical protein [Frankia nepalensis]